MRRLRKNRTKKIKIFLIFLALILISIGGFYVFAVNNHFFDSGRGSGANTTDMKTKATDEQIDLGSQIKKNSIDAMEADNIPNGDGRAQAGSGGKKAVEVTITASSLSSNSSVYQIRSIIGLVTASGTCSLTLTNGEKTITKAAAIQALSSDSTCQGFDIPLSELSSGSWSATLRFENEKYMGVTKWNVQV